MLSLADTECRVRDAIVDGNAAAVTGLLVGGRDPSKRLAIHQRHYETSLTTAIVGKFPATGWLVGASFLTNAAREFVHASAPTAPCVAEYGENFPRFLARRAGMERVPYLHDFADLEWAIGLVSIAIDVPSVALDIFAGVEEAALPDLVLKLQLGVRYIESGWPIDDLIKLYLTGSAPETFALDPADTWIEVRGSRGAFDMKRLGRGEFVFRRAVLEGHSIGNAAEQAIEAAKEFDSGASLAAIIAEGLVTATLAPREPRP